MRPSQLGSNSIHMGNLISLGKKYASFTTNTANVYTAYIHDLHRSVWICDLLRRIKFAIFSNVDEDTGHAMLSEYYIQPNYIMVQLRHFIIIEEIKFIGII